MLDAYLRDLRRELARALPHEDVQARLIEAESHIKEGIEARVELGLDPAEAERETIAAFGQIGRLAQADSNPKERPKLRLMCLGAGYVLALLWTQWLIGYIDRLPHLNAWLFEAWTVLGFVFAGLAFRARSPRPIPIGLTVLASTTLTWLVLGTTWLDLYAFGGSGMAPRNTVAGVVAEDRKLLAERQAGRFAFEEGWKTIHGPQGVEGVRSSAGYRAPFVGASYPNSLRFENVADPKSALDAWNDVHRRGDAFETMTLVQNLSAISQAEPDLRGNLLAMAPGIFEANAGVALAAMLVDYAFGGLGSFVFRLRKGRRRGVA